MNSTIFVIFCVAAGCFILGILTGMGLQIVLDQAELAMYRRAARSPPSEAGGQR